MPHFANFGIDYTLLNTGLSAIDVPAAQLYADELKGVCSCPGFRSSITRGMANEATNTPGLSDSQREQGEQGSERSTVPFFLLRICIVQRIFPIA
jgi:hypothetical protein